MEQVVVKHLQVLSYTVENMMAKVDVLLETVGVSEAGLGKVRYCLLFAYTCCERFHDSSVHRGVDDRHFIGMVTEVRSPPNLLIWL
jgi:hypothetical protein